MGNNKWTPAENAIIVGVLPEYRVRIENGEPAPDVANDLAKQILQYDVKFNFFNERKKPEILDSVNTITQHIKRMDDITKGVQLNRPAMQHELPWVGLLP
ncbi:hypothetical protein [Paenibacillus segetis]|uniref:HTH cro/C1-type domain-containing protein n=1 Tax=Paenibacillus segetis TaxID=1325360 RepID=A0ABQ1Y9I5_9BACL|nr:hypothetical protein [Paenibacillus segetis]GGH17266.1 hypothetical protein GCM10008013_12500 [Paenibacillus segetis]